MKLYSTFRQSKAFIRTSKNERYNLFKLLFQYDSVSIYQRLFDPSIDFHMQGRIEYLVELVSKKSVLSTNNKLNDKQNDNKSLSLIKFKLQN